jgi:endonuclease/exonuclease/phosphatase family metal-dependent hydrolase
LKKEVALGWVVYGILFLFFFQLLADFVEAIYAFGLLGTSIPPEIASVLFLFSPFLLLGRKNGLGRRALVVIIGVMIVARLAEALLDTRGRMLVSGLGVSCFLLLFPAMFYDLRGRLLEGEYKDGIQMGAGLVAAVALSIFLRAVNSGSDLSTSGSYQAIAWILAAVAVILFIRRKREAPPGTPAGAADRPVALGRVVVLSVGLVAVFVLLYFSFTSPNVIARWTGTSYLLVLGVSALSLAGFAWLWARGRLALPAAVLWGWNGLFVTALVLTILPFQIAFPSDPGAYPLAEPRPSALSIVPLLLMLALYPVLFLDFSLLAREMLSLQVTWRSLGTGFGLASLYLLVMIFAHVFTTVYDYIPVVGPYFRDKFWLVYLVAGAATILPLLLGRAHMADLESAPAALPLVSIVLGASAVLGALVIQARPDPAPVGEQALRVMTYNIQQGYSQTGQKSFDEQIEVIRDANPDVLGLQESDTNRIAGGNADLVRTFADRLEMHSYYGPKTVAGTFGIALLSRYPIQNPRTFYMFSEGEQTATIHAQVLVAGKTFNIFVTHLGNGGPLIQQRSVLAETAGLENVILMGDFNFSPDTEQYALTRQQLEDAWLLRWPSGGEAGRIDHVFVSPGRRVTQAEYIHSPTSDHPAEVVEVNW